MKRRTFLKGVITLPLIPSTSLNVVQYPYQKYQPGQRVRINITDANTPFGARSMAHFRNNEEATIAYSYAARYQPSSKSNDSSWKSYSLCFDDGHTSAWYYETQLTAVTLIS